MRLIDTDILYIDWYDSFVADDGTEYDNIPFISKGQIDDAPSIDIVRCGECKHAEYRDDHDEYLCREDGYVHDVDWFCADGKRKEL